MIIKAIEQRFLPYKISRMPEPEMIMFKKEQAEQYDKVGEDGSMAAPYELIKNKILSIASPAGKALDIACGSGQLLCRIAIALPNIEFTAIDLSDNMLNFAHQTCKKNNLQNIELKKVNMYDIDKTFNPKSFDLITWNYSMHHTNTKDEAVLIINRALNLLKNDGILFIFDIERPKNEKILQWFVNNYDEGYGSFFKNDGINSLRAAYSYNEVEEILRKSGWSNYIHVRPVIGNIVQLIHTRTKRNKITQKPCLKYAWQKRDYDLLKMLFLGKI